MIARQIKAFSYIRWSDEQQGKGDSLRRQLEGSRAYAAEQGWVFADPLIDAGLSAFRGRNASAGKLAGFLAAVKAGAVHPGDVLIVENLDRLSRAKPRVALTLFMSILDAGVKIITLTDRKEWTAASVDAMPTDLMMSILFMMRANEESETKSKRVAAAWSNKRRNAGTQPLTAKCPGWIILDKTTQKFGLIPERAKVVRQIVDLALDGLGSMAICRKLNRAGVAGFARTPSWDEWTVRHYLNSKTLIGEYQPCVMVDGKATPTGEPLKGYYPAVIPEATYYMLQGVLASRRTGTGKGRTGEHVANLFGKLLTSGIDGSAMVMKCPRPDNKNMVSAAGKNGSKANVSFSYTAFEDAFLKWMPEVILNESKPVADDTAEIAGKLAIVRAKAAKIEEAMTGDDLTAFARLTDILKGLSTQEAGLEQALEASKASSMVPEGSIADVASIASRLGKVKGDDLTALRAKLRQAISAVVKSIKVYIYSKSVKRLCFAVVQFSDGQARAFAVMTERNKAAVSYTSPKGSGRGYDLFIQSGDWQALANQMFDMKGQ